MGGSRGEQREKEGKGEKRMGFWSKGLNVFFCTVREA